MAIAIDSRNVGTKGVGVTAISWTHTVTSGNLLQVGGSTAAGAPVAMTSVVWDQGGANTNLSNTVNAVAANQVDGGPASGTTWWWWLASPAAGAKTIQCNAASNCEMTGGSSSWSGCAGTFNAASPHKQARAGSINPTTTATSAAGEQVIDVICVNEGGAVTATVGAGQTQIFNQDNGAGTSLGAGSDEGGAATVVMDWTGLNVANNAGTGQVCVSLLPSAAAGSTKGSSLLLCGVGN